MKFNNPFLRTVRYILILLLLVISIKAGAQGVRFSVIAEPQLSWLKSNTPGVSNNGVVAGFNAGMKSEFFFNPTYAFSTGVTIGHLGGKLQFEEGMEIRFDHGTDFLEPGSTVKYNLRYVTIPVGMEFISREIGYTTIYSNLGFGTHFNISATADDSRSEFKDAGIKDEINLFGMSYHIGAGIYYSLGGQTALIGGVIYRHHFMDLITSKSDYNALSHSIFLRTGILF